MELRCSLFLASALALAACDDSHRSGKVTGKDVREAYGEAARTTNAYVSQTRAELVANAKGQIDMADAELARLRARAATAGAEAKGNLDEAIAKLEKQRGQAAQRLSDVQGAANDALGDVAAGLNRAVDELADAAKDAKKRFD